MVKDLNQLLLVGTLKEKPILQESEYGLPYATMIVAVRTNLERVDGSSVQNDYTVKLWNEMAKKVVGVAEIGDFVAIKGELIKNEDGLLEIVVNKVFMLNGE